MSRFSGSGFRYVAPLPELGGGGVGQAFGDANYDEEYELDLAGVFGGEALPLIDLGIEIALKARTLVEIRALRRKAGPSGTTTIVIDKNGVPTAVTLSWTGGVDPDDTSKTAVIALAIVAGDRLTFRITSAEDGNPEDIIVRMR